MNTRFGSKTNKCLYDTSNKSILFQVLNIDEDGGIIIFIYKSGKVYISANWKKLDLWDSSSYDYRIW